MIESRLTKMRDRLYTGRTCQWRSDGQYDPESTSIEMKKTIGSINDLLNDALRFYASLKPDLARVVLVHPGDFALPELGNELGRYASRKLAARGIEIKANTKIDAVIRQESSLPAAHGLILES
jgi:hypothetical protein